MRRRPPSWAGRAAGLSLAAAAALLAAAWVEAQPVSVVREESGYRAFPDRIQVGDAAHWRAWDSPAGTRVVEDEGIVRPRYTRADIDAVRNAGDFMNVDGGDTTFGGVNDYGLAVDSLTAPLVIDGDPETWWEPDTDFLDQAWVEIDLGRAVVAKRIRVRFADSGDPFLTFRVLVSDGTESFGNQRSRRYLRAGQVAVPNKSQREFTFELEPRRPVPEGVTGEPVRYVRVELTGTDGPRAEQVSEAEYARLDSVNRGAVDYYRVTVAGREIPVLEESWQQLPDEERGPARYHRRERPRLAEVGVESLGDNIVALTQRELLESEGFFEDLVRRFVTDGLMRTAFSVRIWDPFRDRDQVRIDLGARFWLDRIRMISDDKPITAYQLRVSDGALDAGGELVWTTFDERINAARYLEVEETFPSRPVRYLELRRLNLLNDERLSGRLNELQAYGEGYVSEVRLTSPLIKFGRRAMVSRVDWVGDAPQGTRLEVRTRSGDEITQVLTFFDRTGRQISEGLWDRLSEDDQGPVLIEEIAGDDWSPWSEVYPGSGSGFLSPSPRRMAMVQVRLRTFEPLRAPTIDGLSLHLVPPLIDRALAEVSPTRGIDPGRARDFTLYLRLEPLASDPGFDAILLRSSAAVPMEPERIRLGADSDLRLDQAATLWPGPALAEPTDEGLRIELPAGERLGEGEVLEVRFRTSVFVPSTTFAVDLVADSSAAEARRTQQVDPGDASGLSPSNALVVVSELEDRPVLAPLEVEPAVLTPNGDGVGDVARLRVTIFQLRGRARLQVSVHDLAGRRVRDLSLRPAALSGEHTVDWDGRDGSGRLVPPGLYVLRVQVPTDADVSGTVAVRTLPVAY